MRRVTYLIDTGKKLGNEFKAYYTLQEDESGITYSLEDMNGKNLNINDIKGLEKDFLNKCFSEFNENIKIPKEYKQYITILAEPREIKVRKNVRYMLFEEYAKENNIKVSNIEYMRFIDNMCNEYERIHYKPSLTNYEEVNNFIKYKVLSQIAENTAKSSIGVGLIQSSSEMNKLLKKYNVSEETSKEDQALFKRINFFWEKGQRDKVIKQYDDMLEKLPKEYKNKYYKYLKFHDKDGVSQNYGELSYKKTILENIEKIEKLNAKVKIFVYWTDEPGIKTFKEKTVYSLERANSLTSKSLENIKIERKKLDMPYISNDIKFSIIIDDGNNFKISKPDDFLLGCVPEKDFYEIIEKHYGKDLLNEIREIEATNNNNEEEEEESL